MATPNIRRGVVPLQEQPLGRAQPVTDLALRPQELETGIDTAVRRIAQQLGALGSQVGQLADRAAQREGAEEGRVAGLDPEFRRRQGGTIRGEAYDAAGVEIQRAQLVTRIGEDLEQAFEQHRGSPAALDAALAERRRHWLANVDPALMGDVESIYGRNRLAYMRQAARDVDQRTAAELRASTTDAIISQITGLQQRARRYGLGGPAPQSSADAMEGPAQVDELIAGELGDLQRRLAVTGPDGRPLFTPDQQRQMLTQATASATRGRILGTFERLPDADAQARFLAEFDADWRASRGIASSLSEEEYTGLSQRMRGMVRTAGRGEGFRALERELTELGTRLTQGTVAADHELQTMAVHVAASGDAGLQTRFREIVQLAESQREALTLPLPELERWVAGEATRLGPTGGTQLERERLGMRQALLTAARRDLASDPVAYGARTGLVTGAPLDLSSAGAFAASLRTRVAEAERVAGLHGVAVRYFTPDEVTQLVARMSQGGDEMVALAGAIAQGGESATPAMLRQLFERAPGLATLAALARSGTPGNMATLIDAARAVQARRQQGWRAVHAIPAPDRAGVARDVLGSAFDGLEEQRDAVLSLADTLYDLRARTAGAGAFDRRLYTRTLRDVLGAHTHGGVTYGGVARQQAWALSGGRDPIIIPPDLRTDGLNQLLRSLRPEDLLTASSDPIGMGTVRGPVAPGGRSALDAIRDGTLVPTGDGYRYWVRTDVRDGEPVYLMTRPGTGPGGRFILDLERLGPVLRDRRPDLFYGARPMQGAPVVMDPLAAPAGLRAVLQAGGATDYEAELRVLRADPSQRAAIRKHIGTTPSPEQRAVIVWLDALDARETVRR